MRAHSLPALLLTTALVLPMGAAGQTAQDPAFGDAVRAYLLEHPEVIVEAMEVLKGREAVAEEARDKDMLVAHKDRIFQDGASWVGGNPDGDITIVEFTDYRCTYCRKAFAEVEELVKADGNIRFVVKEFPILGDASVISSRFAIAVLQIHGSAAYKQAHDGLIALRGEPDEGTLAALAGELGLDPAPILQRMNSAEVSDVITANHALGQDLAISGTPTFVLGGQMLRGYVPLDAMQQMVAAERG